MKLMWVLQVMQDYVFAHIYIPLLKKKERAINKAFLKYGFNSFELAIYSISPFLNREAARILEQYYILTTNSAYNTVKVAGTGQAFSDAAKLAQSKKLSIPVFVYRNSTFLQPALCLGKTTNLANLIYYSKSFTQLAKDLAISRKTILKYINTGNLYLGVYLFSDTFLSPLDSGKKSCELSNVAATSERVLMSAVELKTEISAIRGIKRSSNFKGSKLPPS